MYLPFNNAAPGYPNNFLPPFASPYGSGSQQPMWQAQHFNPNLQQFQQDHPIPSNLTDQEGPPMHPPPSSTSTSAEWDNGINITFGDIEGLDIGNEGPIEEASSGLHQLVQDKQSEAQEAATQTNPKQSIPESYF